MRNNAFDNDIMEDKAILGLAELAKQAKMEYEQKKESVEQKMLEWLRERLPVGTKINIKYCSREKSPRPPYLMNVKVMAGNARNTGSFRIEEIRDVELHPSYPFMSTWSCYATPISETTGKDMKATAGHSLNGPAKYIILHGHIGNLD